MPESWGKSRFRGFRSALSAAVLLFAGLAATPAAAAPGGSGPKHSSRHSNEDSYILSLGNSSTSTNISIDEYARLRGERAGDFLWFRRAGKAYLIEDPATLKEARALFAPLRALEPEQEDLRRREEALDEKEQGLDRQEEDIDRRMDPGNGEDEWDDDDAGAQIAPASDADQKELERQRSEIRSRQREIEAASREIERVERSLDAREDAIEREAEAKLWTLIDAAAKRGLAKPS
jgi:hypothetical protein